jgi:uncharacterized membrane protein
MSEIPPPTVPPATPPPPGGGSYTPPPPPPPGGPAPGGPAQSSDRGVMIFLSYFGIFALIPLLTKKDDPDIQWHAKNGLALAVVWIVVLILLGIVGFMLPSVVRLGMIGIRCVIWLGFLIVDVMAMVKAFGGQRMRIPVITDFAEKM